LSLTDALGKVTTYGHDAANRLTSVSHSDGVTPNVSAIVYDAVRPPFFGPVSLLVQETLRGQMEVPDANVMT
jgi:YD repeat-containing protein